MTDPIAKLLGEWSQTLNGASVLFRILLSVCLSAMIGCERSSKRHSAGLRTFILVSLATTVTMLLDQYLAAAAAMEFFALSSAASGDITPSYSTLGAVTLRSSPSQTRSTTTLSPVSVPAKLR